MNRALLIIVLFWISSPGFSQMIIGNGTRWVSGPSGYLVLQNMDLTVNTSSPVSGIIRFTGNSDMTLGGSVSPSFSNIVLAKSGGILKLGNTIGISNTLSFTGGILNLNGNNIYLDETATLQNESESSHIMGYPGMIQMKYEMNAPQSVNPGNLGAIFTSSGNFGIVLISRGHEPQTVNSNAASISRYFDIQPSNNSNLDATLRFTYLDTELNGLDENNLVLWRSPALPSWSNQGYTARDPLQNFVEKSGISQFSRWTLSSTGNALPVTGLQLSGTLQNGIAVLNWITLSEYNNSHFIIERKFADENQFFTTGVKPTMNPGGNATGSSHYHFYDTLPLNHAATVQYRLRQVDKDGHFIYSNTILIQLQSADKRFITGVYPTIIRGSSFFVRTGNTDTEKMGLRIYDASGRLMMNRELRYESQQVSVNHLAKGLYFVEFRSGNRHYSVKLIKE